MTSKRIKTSSKWQDDYGDYGGYGSEEEYHSDGETAMKESKAAYKAEQRKKEREKKKAAGVKAEDIDAIEKVFAGQFTREQIKGTLEAYKNQENAV